MRKMRAWAPPPCCWRSPPSPRRPRPTAFGAGGRLTCAPGRSGPSAPTSSRPTIFRITAAAYSYNGPNYYPIPVPLLALAARLPLLDLLRSGRAGPPSFISIISICRIRARKASSKILLGGRVERSRSAPVADADLDRDPAMDVAFVARLTEGHLLHVPDQVSFVAKHANAWFWSVSLTYPTRHTGGMTPLSLPDLFPGHV